MAVVVINHLSLDGVMQGPGGADEDTRDGFTLGGWATSDDPETGQALGAAMGAVMGEGFSWLFGHRSYDQMLGHWNEVGGPFRDGLNGPMKYVASRDPDAELPWPRSTLVHGDVPTSIKALRDDHPGNLVIMGSGQLIRSLLPHGLVDEMLLLVHPVVLGAGRTMFGGADALRRFALVSSEAADDGTVITRYRAA